MRLTIELTPEQGARLFAAAKMEGIDLAQLARDTNHEFRRFLSDLETGALGKIADQKHFYFTASREEFNGALNELAEMNRGLPVLSDDAFDREVLYEDRV